MFQVLTSNKRIGNHVKYQSDVYKTLKNNDEQYTMQFFGSNPRTYNVIKEFDTDRVGKYTKANNKTFYIHANYPVLAGYPINSDKYNKCINNVNTTLERLSGSNGSMIMHISKGKESNIDNVVEFLNNVEYKSPLYIENAAGQGYELGKTYEELNYILDKVPNNVGICIDTQHSFASGMIDFRSINEIDNMLHWVGDRNFVLHLNDSECDFGKGKDCHGNIDLLDGYIWKDDQTSFKYLLKEMYERKTDMILETGGNYNDYQNIIDNYYYYL